MTPHQIDPDRSAARSLFLVLSMLACAPASADSSGWRGDGSGRYPNATPPIHWAPDRNVVWSTPTPGWGNATPALSGDRLFLTAEPTTLLAVSAADGHILWQHEVTFADTIDTHDPAAVANVKKEMEAARALAAELEATTREMDRLRREARKKSTGPEVKQKLEALSRGVAELRVRYDQAARYRPVEDIPTVGNASSSPVTDGNNVFAIFGNFVVAGFSRDGKLRWARWLPPADPMMHAYARGQSASPLLVGGKLIVPLGRLRALDPATGKTLWESDEYRDYGTPGVVRVGNAAAVLTPDGHAVRVSDGKLLTKTLPFIYYVGPVVDGNVVYYAGNSDANPPNPAAITAFRVASLEAPFEPRVLWRRPLANARHYATPVLADRALVVVEEPVGRSSLNIAFVDVERGDTLGQKELELTGETFPSPAVAGGYLYVSVGDGTTVVLEAKRPFREVARNKLEAFRACPIFAGRKMYIRTLERLYCIEEK